ncbi:MAG TPA: rhomboid family intramembrane serine protease [Terriglobia bacterium]|nr:rhomboid family intramembrane serine protease [Terriglobia bacterium]
MFPFRDNIPSRTFPFVTIALILINTGVFLYELSLGSGLGEFLRRFGLVPEHAAQLVSARTGLSSVAIPYLTSMFLHGGWFHLIGNMWYLWIFGDNVEDRLGHFKFIVFYLLCGLAAGATHTVLNLHSSIPSVGASGAIAGVLGAYVVSYPFARVSTFVVIIIFFQVVEIPAIIVLGFWFVMQFLQANGGAASGVAWWAHIGGFIAGIALLFLMAGRKRQPYGYARF